MATRHFDNASLGAVPESLLPHWLLMSGYAAPLRYVRAQRAAIANRDENWAFAESGNIGRCIRWAFAIEGGVALVIWALIRLIW
jgi:hypothetical protein